MQTTAQELHLSRSEAEDFLYRQAEFIDTRDFESWIDLFTPDATYWIPARPGDTNPKTQVSFLYDDVPSMAARCERLLDAGTGGQQPGTRCNHIVSNVRVVPADTSGVLVVKSRFQVTQFRRDAMKSYVGSYTHHLVATDNGIKIRLQRVDLIDCDGIHDAILQVYL
ncbi:benzoate/toluate 1,2-dioxygenase beta subunit [Rhodoferax ferrireducens]|uniref:Benzoate/toluate 1,2-dioxygenase beta subunit n=1 Tax=Rhodoferax ferrireducens TaxID=192843 RepID=A0ABU2CD91_9BURK|nr:aromatic-ring-hydroxylating dioxygenase subunit beta [Rhodoferax ferrireducens]MDR7379304.1 benzoate/toluate 1,2-dioxygenase beta subunit [Rhodoferax ferrireducens]